MNFRSVGQSLRWSCCGYECSWTLGKTNYRSWTRRSSTSWQESEWSNLHFSDSFQHPPAWWSPTAMLKNNKKFEFSPSSSLFHKKQEVLFLHSNAGSHKVWAPQNPSKKLNRYCCRVHRAVLSSQHYITICLSLRQSLRGQNFAHNQTPQNALSNWLQR